MRYEEWIKQPLAVDIPDEACVDGEPTECQAD